MTDFKALVHALHDAGAEFILIGGVAAIAHGSSRLTRDLDVVYRRTPESVARASSGLWRLSSLTCAVLRRVFPFAGTKGRSWAA